MDRQKRHVKRLWSIPAICMVIIFSSHIFSSAQDVTGEVKSTDLSGTVMINVYEDYGREGFLEYSLSLPDFVMKETNRGNKGFGIGHPEKLYMLSSDTFGRVYKTERMYWEPMVYPLMEHFSQDNMEYLEFVLETLSSKQERLSELPYSEALSVRARQNRDQAKYLIPNRQFTHIIYRSKSGWPLSGLLVDLSKHTVSFPFGRERLSIILEWDYSGKHIAYASSKDSWNDRELLVITDIVKNIELFRVDLDKEIIFDIAWAPTDNYLAVLSVKWKLSYNPFALLATASGHPAGYRTYYLRVYDITGKLIYRSRDEDIGGTFSAGPGSGLGGIVWCNVNGKKNESPMPSMN